MSEHDDHADLPVAARVRRLEERLIGAGLASDAEIDGFLRRLYREAGPVNQPVVCRRGNVLVAAFHPELAGDWRLHELFLSSVGSSADGPAH